MVPLKRARGVIRHLKSPDEMDLEEVTTSVNVINVIVMCEI